MLGGRGPVGHRVPPGASVDRIPFRGCAGSPLRGQPEDEELLELELDEELLELDELDEELLEELLDELLDSSSSSSSGSTVTWMQEANWVIPAPTTPPVSRRRNSLRSSKRSAWKSVGSRRVGPSFMAFSRQSTPDSR